MLPAVQRVLAGLLLLWLAAPGAAAQEPSLRFARDGETVAVRSLAELRSACTVERVRVADPYYGREKRYWACPLRQVLAAGFGAQADLAGENFFLLARDGYARPAEGRQLLEAGGYLAFADAGLTEGPEDAPRFEPIDRRQLDPGPFYVVWSGADQSDPHRHPWPYQLAEVELAPFEREYPHTSPRDAPPDAPAWRGFAIFRRECIACHAINTEGGRVGPELNVPRSIVEYRPGAQIKAYVRDPQSFRYTTMPAHPHLADADLDALLAYFAAMSKLKWDPKDPPAP